jgi:hypothetical protein
VACTKEYKPVCGAKQITCITAPCNPIQQTYSNTCLMQADGATFSYEGQCRADQDPALDRRCKAWYDGCNNCARETADSAAACTLRACFVKGPAYCTAYFDSADANKPPTISGFSGPTTLSTGQSGTWSVSASDPEGGSLSYYVEWGDAGSTAPSSFASLVTAFVQTTTFTHAYSGLGVYTVTLVVRDSAGKEAKTTTTVRVGVDSIICTEEYAPVCGQPPEPTCRNTPPYCMIPTPGPQTYANRCFMNAAGASLLYEGQCQTAVACTADAYQCPDGSYVGRSGSNCQFVCPNGAIY